MWQLANLKDSVTANPTLRSSGQVVSARGAVITARIPYAALGDACLVKTISGAELAAQVVAFEDDLVTLAPFGQLTGVAPGAKVLSLGRSPRIPVGAHMLGAVLDAAGRPLNRPLAEQSLTVPIDAAAPGALVRRPIDTVLETGIRAIDSFCTLGRGQRMGLFAAAGTGKSTLLGMLARRAEVDVTVVGLVGERGREVNEFIARCLGEDGMRRSVVVVSTSDEAPLRRSSAAQTATAIAEYFRDRGQHVLLLIDSLTRFARAVRDVTLAAGEPPVRHGFTPTVFGLLPRLLERAGTGARGSITAIYTVLTYDDDEHDPLAEEIKSIIDGHIVLSRRVAEAGIRPAIDITQSISRLMPELHPAAEDLQAIETVRAMAAKIRHEKDLVLLGGMPDHELAQALKLEGRLKEFLNQGSDTVSCRLETLRGVRALAEEYRAGRAGYGAQLNIETARSTPP